MLSKKNGINTDKNLLTLVLLSFVISLFLTSEKFIISRFLTLIKMDIIMTKAETLIVDMLYLKKPEQKCGLTITM